MDELYSCLTAGGDGGDAALRHSPDDEFLLGFDQLADRRRYRQLAASCQLTFMFTPAVTKKCSQLVINCPQLARTTALDN